MHKWNKNLSTDDRQFRDFLKNQEETLDVLPVIHTTNTRSFGHLLFAGKLAPQFCEKFNDDLLYLFYGRPAYRTSSGRVGFLAKFAAPVVFIFHPMTLIGKIKQIYPFDTGAFKKGMYSAFFDKNHPIETLEMGREFDSITRMISAFYRGNEEYLRNHSSKNPNIDPFDFTTDGVRSVILSNQFQSPDGNSKRDERSTSIEIQVINEISLKNEGFLGIILPNYIVDVPDVANALKLWKPKYVKFYDVASTQTYEFWHGQIFSKTLEIYRSEGYI